MPSKHPKPRRIDVTIRIQRRDGRKTTEADARRALWAAHEILRKGGRLSEALREWRVSAIDWRNTFASGNSKEYQYTTDIEEVLGNLGGVLRTVGIGALRVAPHTKGE